MKYWLLRHIDGITQIRLTVLYKPSIGLAPKSLGYIVRDEIEDVHAGKRSLKGVIDRRFFVLLNGMAYRP